MSERRGKKTGRGARGRCVATRPSRRVQGLEPEEQKDVDIVVREARMAKKAARAGGAVKGDVESSSDQEQLLVEPPSHEADAETREADLADASPCQEASRVKEERAREGDAQASVGGADLVESPEVVGLLSESVSSDEAKSLNGSVIEIKRDPASFITEDGNQDADTDPDAAPSAPEV